MGKSAKFHKIGQTKKERDQIKIAKNSRVTKPDAPTSSKVKKALKAQGAPKPAAAKSIIKKSQVKPKEADGDVQMGNTSAGPSAPSQPKKHVLDGRVDYVSLMSSRRSGAQLKKKMIGTAK
ncbi:hypothetical protein HDV00_011443 [Rhizophlyctis rosea]|nr:hypothetical protein HDV00_011443 [Rhizophlyctis rosea]